MYNLKAITMENFGPYLGKVTVPFDSGVYHILGTSLDHPGVTDSNGAGKTTILNAISWGLFGKTLTSLKGGQVINDGCKQAKVTLTFDQLEIVRSYGRRHELEYTLPGCKPRINDVLPLQVEIEGLIGLNYQTFLSTCCMLPSLGSTKFLYSEPGERAKLLSELVDDEVFQKVAKKMLADMSAYEAKVQQSFAVQQSLSQQLYSKQHQIAQFNYTYAEAEKAEINRKDVVQTKLAQLRNQYYSIAKEMDEPPPETMDELQLQIANLMHTQNEIEGHLMELRQTCSGGRPVYGGLCPSCFQYVTEDVIKHYEEASQTFRERAQQMQAELTSVLTKLSALKNRYQFVADWHSQQKVRAQQLRDIQERILELEDGLKLDHLNMLRAQKNDLERELADMQNRLRTAENEIGTYGYWRGILQKLQPGMASDIRNILFDRIRGELETATAHYGKIIADGMFYVHYPTKNHLAREKFEIMIDYAGKTREILGLSTGEGYRVSFAILLALRALMLNRTKSRLNLLLIDDPIAGLDITGLNGFYQLVHRLQQLENNLVLITMPMEGVIPQSGKVINVKKHMGMSKIV